MGTSLSGLTPATTFDGLLKVGDNDPLTADLKAISTGDGTDTILQLSDSALQVNGDLNIGTIHQAYQVLNDLVIKGNSGSTYLKYYTNNGNNLTNQFGIGNFLKYNTAIGDSTLPTTSSPMLRIKGSGAGSGTTSLLVQNSAGTDYLKVTDDGNVQLSSSTNVQGNKIYGEGNTNKSINLSGSNTYSAYAKHQFNTWDGTAYSEAMRITGFDNTSQFVGIGETTPTARLHVKGSGNDANTIALRVQNSAGTDTLIIGDDGFFKVRGGAGVSNLIRTNTTNNNVGIGLATPDSASRMHIQGKGTTSATTSLLVQNSAGTDLLNVTDDGFVNTHQTLIVNHPTNSSRSLRLGWGSIFATDNASELNIGAVYSQNTAPRIVLGGKTRASGADAVLVQALNGMYLSTTASTEDPSAQLHIKGSGTTSATTALLVQNSAGTDLLKVNDDNNVIVASIRAVGNLRLGASGTDRYYLTSAQIHPLGNQDLGRDNSTSYHWNNVYSTGITHITDNTTSSTTLDASAKLQVDSTTQGFLPPRMTDAERDAIATPAAGLMIYDTTNNQMNYWNGSTWIAF